MSLEPRAATHRDVMTATNVNRSTAMMLMHQELARDQMSRRQEEALRARRARALLAHRRWQRRAQRAALRARLALASL
jgi:hypothetical protein